MDEVCEQCGATISRRARANVWNDEKVVCTSCLKELQGAERRTEAAHALAGKPGAPWLVRHGQNQQGPYPTEQLIELLRRGRVDWLWEIKRDGMTAWKKAANLFTIPELSNGKIELRDFGQGDGTYRPPFSI
jgi:hypothetical protein